MTTNPYAAPADVGEVVNRAEREIHSVVRTFRLTARFAIAEALVFSLSTLVSVVRLNAGYSVAILYAVINAATIVCAIFYLRAAARMSRKELAALTTARRLSLLMVVSFPLFPIGLTCFPVFAVVGTLCYRKVTRYYREFCEVPA